MVSKPEQINSPWGTLKNSMLLLDNPQQISMSGNNLNILFGLLYLDDTSGTFFKGDLKITNRWSAKTPMKVRMFYDRENKKWCATDGFLATVNSKAAVFNGLTISIIGGREKPLVIGGKPFFGSVVEIKNGKVYKIDQPNHS